MCPQRFCNFQTACWIALTPDCVALDVDCVALDVDCVARTKSYSSKRKVPTRANRNRTAREMLRNKARSRAAPGPTTQRAFRRSHFFTASPRGVPDNQRAVAGSGRRDGALGIERDRIDLVSVRFNDAKNGAFSEITNGDHPRLPMIPAHRDGRVALERSTIPEAEFGDDVEPFPAFHVPHRELPAGVAGKEKRPV